MIKFPILEDTTKKIRQNVTTKYIFTDAIPLNSNCISSVCSTDPLEIGTVGSRLISQQASVNELGKELLTAATAGDVTKIRTLLTKGAPFTADWLGTSPLHLAAQNNHSEICEILLRAGISKDARTKVDKTPLHMAAYEGHLEIVEILLNHGADLDARDLLSMTPLHWAVQNGHIEVTDALIKRGAQPYAVNKFNLTALDIAYQINRSDITDLIISGINDSSVAAQNLVIQLAEENGENSNSMDDHSMPVESILTEDEPSESQDCELIDEDSSSLQQIENGIPPNDDHQFTASMKILQEHGITMLPNDDTNILSTVMESGHSVVLTDVGKEVLNSVKQSEQSQQLNNKKIMTVTAEEFIAMTTNGTLNKNNFVRQIKVIPPKSIKRIVMHKNKIAPVMNTPSVSHTSKECVNSHNTDMELVMTQLIEARRMIDEYKTKLSIKEKEAEKYKEQLKLLMNTS